MFLTQSTTRADTPKRLDLVLPDTVTVILNQDKIVFTGRSGLSTMVECEQGSFLFQSAVVIDPGGGRAAQITNVVAIHDHEIQNGSRYLIVGNLGICGVGFMRYNTSLDEPGNP